MTTNTQLKGALLAMSPLAASDAFAEIRTPYFCFARQRGPFVDRVSVWATRHGNFAEATATIWSPYLASDFGLLGASLDVESMTPTVGGDLSTRRVRESWMWDIRPPVFEPTIRELAEAIRTVALPWFESVNSGEALLRECALNPDYWRKVSRASREHICSIVDQAVRGEVEVPRLRLLDQKSSQKITPHDTAGSLDATGYEQIQTLYQSESSPSLTGTVTALRKKKT